MRLKTPWLGFLLLLTVVGLGGVAGLQHVETRRVQQVAAELEGRAAAIRARSAKLEREQRRDAQAENALRQALLALTQATLTSAPEAAVVRASQPFDVNQLIAERPELKSLYEAGARAAEMETYGWLIVALAPDAAERFVSERLHRERRLSEIGRTSREQGWARDDPRRQALRRAEEERHARELAAILDPVRLRQYQDYEQTLRAHHYVSGDLARELYYTNTPLTSVQARALTELVTRNGRDARGRFDFDAVNWDGLLREARAQLEPAQFERLANLAEMRGLQTQVLAIERAFGARADGK